MLLFVWFNNSIYYDKKEGLKTNEKPVVITILRDFLSQNPVSYTEGAELKTKVFTLINELTAYLNEKAAIIERIIYLIKLE